MLEIKSSPIHGLGVFATQKLLPTMKLAEYTGDKYTLKEFKEKYGKDITYCYVARRANYILCAKEKRNIIIICKRKQKSKLLYCKKDFKTSTNY